MKTPFQEWFHIATFSKFINLVWVFLRNEDKFIKQIWVHMVIFTQCIYQNVLQLSINHMWKRIINMFDSVKYLVVQFITPNTDKTYVLDVCFCRPLNAKLSMNELITSWSSYCSLCHVTNLPIMVEYGYIPFVKAMSWFTGGTWGGGWGVGGGGVGGGGGGHIIAHNLFKVTWIIISYISQH